MHRNQPPAVLARGATDYQMQREMQSSLSRLGDFI